MIIPIIQDHHGYYINGVESPVIELIPGVTYKFDQSDSSNDSHPLRFYLEEDKSTSYTTGVTTNGTAGSSGAYTQIAVTHTTKVLYYQCSAHGYMGNYVNVKATTTKTITNNLSVGGNSHLTGSLSVGGVNVLSSTLSVGGACVLESTLSVGGKTNLSNGLNVLGVTNLWQT